MYGAIEATQLRAIVFCFKRYSGHVTCTNGFLITHLAQPSGVLYK